MSSDDKKAPKTLSDSDIRTEHKTGRRNFLGLMALGGAAGAAAALTGGAAQAQAQITDSDNGQWADKRGCGRGSGGIYTGASDADNGSAGTDASGYGRGAPYC